MQVKIEDFSLEIKEGRDFAEVLTYLNHRKRADLRAIGLSYPAGHIFDEEKSVKWNREQVIEQNDAKAVARSIINSSYDKLYAEIKEHIRQYCQSYLEVESVSPECVNHLVEYLNETFGEDWPKLLDINLNVIKTFLHYQ